MGAAVFVRTMSQKNCDEAIPAAGIARVPPRVDVDSELELGGDARGDETQRAVRRFAALLRDAPQVDVGDQACPHARSVVGGAVQQARFADRERAEHAAQALRSQRVREPTIRRAFDVAPPFGLNRTADDEKLRGLPLGHTRHAARL